MNASGQGAGKCGYLQCNLHSVKLLKPVHLFTDGLKSRAVTEAGSPLLPAGEQRGRAPRVALCNSREHLRNVDLSLSGRAAAVV